MENIFLYPYALILQISGVQMSYSKALKVRWKGLCGAERILYFYLYVTIVIYFFSSMIEYLYFVVLSKSQQNTSLLSHQEQHDFFFFFADFSVEIQFFLISRRSGNRWIKGLLCPVEGL